MKLKLYNDKKHATQRKWESQVHALLIALGFLCSKVSITSELYAQFTWLAHTLLLTNRKIVLFASDGASFKCPHKVEPLCECCAQSKEHIHSVQLEMLDELHD